MAIKKGDFVEIEYTGMLKEDNFVFDTTSKEKAAETGIANQNMKYGAITICIGEGHVLEGIDKQLVGKESGKEYKFTIIPEEGFGKKNAKLIQLIATHKFTKAGINPQPGLQVNIDNMVGIIRTVTGGRVIVDFNHPLSGKDLLYEVKVNKLVENDTDKVKAILNLGLNENDADVKVEGKKATIGIKIELPKEVKETLSNKIKELTGIEAEILKKEEKKTDKKDEKAETKDASKAAINSSNEGLNKPGMHAIDKLK